MIDLDFGYDIIQLHCKEMSGTESPADTIHFTFCVVHTNLLLSMKNSIYVSDYAL